MAGQGDITVLLRDAHDGRDGAVDELMDRVYADLERIALKHLSRRFGDKAGSVTLEPAALVNESFLRLIKQRKSYNNRSQFFAIATRVMLRVLVDYQRRQLTARRGGEHERISLPLDGRPDPAPAPGGSDSIGVESLTAALERLEALDARQAEVVKLRVVWGLEVRQIAHALGLSPSTVKRDWRFARAWLMDEVAHTGQGAQQAGPMTSAVTGRRVSRRRSP